jgi:hypothetical protein
MGHDEATIVKTLAAYKDVFKTLIIQNRGSVVDSPGDNLLANLPVWSMLFNALLPFKRNR